jgi:hypothetical protein
MILSPIKTTATAGQARSRDLAWLQLARASITHKLAALFVMLAGVLLPECGICGDAPAFTEYQVKALFLLNFTKYVDWPAETLALADTPFAIGVLGANNFGDELKKIVEGKTVGGHKIIILQADTQNDWNKCQMLFISASEKKRLPEVLSQVRNLPILTVGETDQFTQQGGVINFTKKDGKVRLEVDLNAARQAKLQISSRLLSVADVVRGKP